MRLNYQTEHRFDAWDAVGASWYAFFAQQVGMRSLRSNL